MSKKRKKSEVKQTVDPVGTDQPDEETGAAQDSYDGYYDDVLPRIWTASEKGWINS